MKERLGHIGELGKTSGLRLLAAYSEQDEYVPGSVEKHSLLNRLVGAMNNGEQSGAAEGIMLKSANHNLSESSEDKTIFVKAIGNFLRGFNDNK